MARSTREDLIRASYELFISHGFSAVGVDQIIAQVGVTKSTFYNHFESKEALLGAVLEWRDEVWPNKLRASLCERAGENPRDQLLAFFDVLDEAYGTRGFNGCIFISAAAAFPEAHSKIHMVVKDHVESVGIAIRDLAAYAGARDAKEFAGEMLLLVTGAYALGQMYESSVAQAVGRRMATRLVNDYLPVT